MSQASLYSQNINFVFTSSSVPVAPSWSKGPCVKKTDSTATGQPFRASKNCWNPKHGFFSITIANWGRVGFYSMVARNDQKQWTTSSKTTPLFNWWRCHVKSRGCQRSTLKLKPFFHHQSNKNLNEFLWNARICSRQNHSQQVPYIQLWDPNPWWDLAGAFSTRSNIRFLPTWTNWGKRPKYWAPNNFAYHSYLPVTPKLWVQTGHPSSPGPRWRSCRWRWTTGSPGWAMSHVEPLWFSKRGSQWGSSFKIRWKVTRLQAGMMLMMMMVLAFYNYSLFFKKIKCITINKYINIIKWLQVKNRVWIAPLWSVLWIGSAYVRCLIRTLL